MAELRRRLRNEKVAILGFGREGRSSSDLLRRLSLCKDVVVADGNEVLMRECEASEPENSGLSFRKLDCEAVKGRSLILKTPGIACKRLPYVEKEKISSQTELFLALFNRQIIGVSGTKGKSTTASLIYNMIKAQRENVIRRAISAFLSSIPWLPSMKTALSWQNYLLISCSLSTNRPIFRSY